MAIRQDKRLWIRKLDGDMHVVSEQPMLRLYPTNLDELSACIDMARNPPLGGIRQARGIASHWGISHVGVTRGFMIETASPVHEPDGNQTAPRLNNVLYDVIPDCLHEDALAFFHRQTVPTFDPSVKPTHNEIYLVHVEAGARIHEIYATLDKGDAENNRSLASLMQRRGAVGDYSGPWAFETLGGAGGQTIVGAMSTATHGGDSRFGPVGDAVVALHLVDANGQHHWIERTRLRPTSMPMPLVDKTKLQLRYPMIQYHSDDEMMRAVTVACGRMGVIYSVVLRVVRQYALHEKTALQDWSNVKTWLTNPNAPPFLLPNRFVKIDINPYGNFWHPSKHDCYVVTRELRELDFAGKGAPLGRAERGANPGKGPPLGQGGGFFDRVCDTDFWIRKALNEFLQEIKDIREKAVKTWLICAGLIAFPLTPPWIKLAALSAQQGAAATILWTTSYISVTHHILDFVIQPLKATFSDTIAGVANFCAHQSLFAILRAIFRGQYEANHAYNPDYPRTPAISYAAMDEHDYLNIGCVAPGDSIEIFFDATDPKLVAFLDLVLVRVRQLENGDLKNGQPEAFGGYISLRFMAQSESHLAMQKWPRTCSIEIAGLSRVQGTQPFLEQIEADAISFGAALHWGQRNNWMQKEVEAVHFATGPNGDLFKWRDVLSKLTDHGRYDIFSTSYTKQTGLEITGPIIRTFLAIPTNGCADGLTSVAWEAESNPPETRAFLVRTQQGGATERIELGELSGAKEVRLGAGRSTLSLVLERELNGNVYADSRAIDIRGFKDNDQWKFAFVATPRQIDGNTHWLVEINLFSQFISNNLRVAEIRSSFAGITAWTLRNPDIGDLRFTTINDHHILPSRPIFNKRWLIFSDSPVVTGQAPAVEISFTLVCQQ